jgi:hypothetical protein
MLKGDEICRALRRGACLVITPGGFRHSRRGSLAWDVPVMINGKENIWRKIVHEETGRVSTDSVEGA